MPDPQTGLLDRMASRFEGACRTLRRGVSDRRPVPRKIIYGVTPRGDFGGVSASEALAEAVEVLVQSGRCFRHGQAVVFAWTLDEHPALESIWEGGVMSQHAPALLANLFVTATDGEHPVESTPPAKFVAALLGDEQLHRALPRIRHRLTRGGFDADFEICGPGWNRDSGIFVEGPALVPAPLGPVVEAGRYRDRLPPHLAGLLGEFAFLADADLAGVVAVLLTGLLNNHFVEVPHPAILVDGNQPSVGKSLLVQVLGRVLDGLDPAPIRLGPDEELAKHLGAQIRRGRSSVLFFDNHRGPVNSPLLEASILAPAVSVRLLGQSALIERPNTYLFCFTSNDMAATSDLISRSVIVQLNYEGDAERRRFERDPLDYAREHRSEILGELAGLVQRWRQRGRPDGERSHRCGRWARVIGGILGASGLAGPFLANLDAARAQMDEGRQKFTEVALEALKEPTGTFWVEAGAPAGDVGQTPADWVPLFERAGLVDRRHAGSIRSTATAIGKLLTPLAERGAEAVLEHGGAAVAVKLSRRRASGNRNFYYLETRVAAEVGPGGPAPCEAEGSPPAAPCPAEPAGDIDSTGRPDPGPPPPSPAPDDGDPVEPSWF